MNIENTQTTPTERVQQRLGQLHLSSYELRELKYICDLFGISRGTATLLCRALKVPLFYIKESALYNQSAFERILYVLTRYGGPGFAAPGSYFKAKGMYKTMSAKDVLTYVPEDLHDKAEDPLILVEMAATGGNKTSAKALANVISRINTKLGRNSAE